MVSIFQRFFLLTLLFGVFSLGACTLPDVSPYADKTLKLKTVNSQEMGTVLSKMDEVLRDSTTYNANITLTNADRKSFAESISITQEVLEGAVSYSRAIASLAASNPDGKEAAQGLIGVLGKAQTSLNNLGIASMLPQVKLGQTALTAASVIGRVITDLQKIKSLKKAVEKAQPAVDAMRDVLLILYSPCAVPTTDSTCPNSIYNFSNPHAQSPWGMGITSLYRAYRKVRTSQMGIEQYGLYLNLQKKLEQGYLDLNQGISGLGWVSKGSKKCFGKVVGTQLQCFDVKEFEGIKEFETLKKSLDPKYQKFERAMKEMETWKNQRFVNMGQISQAVRVWAQEHQKLVDALDKCGFLKKCQGIDFSVLDEVLSLIKF